MTATFGKLAFNFPLLSQVPGGAAANKQFIGRKIGSFYYRITLPRPINLHLDCQYSIDRPIIAGIEKEKFWLDFHSPFLILALSIPGLPCVKYEQADYFLSLHFLSSLFPAGSITPLQQI